MNNLEKYTFAERQKAIALFMGIQVKSYKFLFFFTLYDIVQADGTPLNGFGFKSEAAAWKRMCEFPFYYKWGNLMPVVEHIEWHSGYPFVIKGSSASTEASMQSGYIVYHRKQKYDAVFLVASDYAITYCIKNSLNFTQS